MPALRGNLQQHLASGRGHGAQLRTHGGSGAAAKGAHVPGSEIGVAHHHRDGLERNLQLLGDQLGQRGTDVLSHLHLAGKHLHLAIGRNVQPGAQLLWKLVGTEGPARLLRQRGGVGETDQQPTSEDFQKVATVQRGDAGPIWRNALDKFICGLNATVHRLAPWASEREARLTASTMRGYVPHRQICPSIATTICSSVGLRRSCSKDVAPRIIPEVQ